MESSRVSHNSTDYMEFLFGGRDLTFKSKVHGVAVTIHMYRALRGRRAF
jgi:hypothetical protein